MRNFSLGELAKRVCGKVQGDPNRIIQGVNSLGEAREGELSFYNNARYRDELQQTRACAVLVEESVAAQITSSINMVIVANPYLAFARISALFHPRGEYSPGVDPRAWVEPGAVIDATAKVMAFCYVGKNAKIGPRSVLFPFVFVGEHSEVGEDSILYPHVVIREECVVGSRAVLQPGVVLGGDGFGFAYNAAAKEHFKVPQVGRVEVQDDVEIGSNSAVDRATLGKTIIGKGSKLDNLVQVGHNVKVGPLCILCGQVGVAGSSELGAGVVCGGQVGIGNHVTIAGGARIGAQSGIKDDIKEPGEFLGSPVLPLREQVRNWVAFQRGSESIRTLRRLEKRMAELEARITEVEGSD